MKINSLIRAMTTAGVVAFTAGVPAAFGADTPSQPKNVLLFISHGASWGTWDVASYYQHRAKGLQPYDNFEVKLGMTTYPLNTSTTPTNNNTPMVSY